MIVGIKTSDDYFCENCDGKNRLNGLRLRHRCSQCGEVQDLAAQRRKQYDGGLRYYYGVWYDVLSQAMVAAAEGEELHDGFIKCLPCCLGCKATFEEGELFRGAEVGAVTCRSCGRATPVRPANEGDRAYDPRIDLVVNDPGDLPVEKTASTSAQGVVIHCMTCGSVLPAAGQQRSVVCQYCGNANEVPELDWPVRFEGRGTHWFFLVAKVDDLRLVEAYQAVLRGYKMWKVEDVAKRVELERQLGACLERWTMTEVTRLLAGDLGGEGRWQQLVEVLGGQGVGPEACRMVMDACGPDQQIALVNTATIAPALVATLSRARDAGVRRVVAGRAVLPDDLAIALAGDPDEDVLEVLARRASLPDRAQPLLAMSMSSRVLASLARNRVTGVEILERLGKHPDPSVAAAARENERYPRGLLGRLVHRLTRR